MNAITMESKGNLGPVPTAEVCVNRIPTQALLDTGAPSTIAFLKFVLKVLRQDRPKYKSLAQ